MPNKDAITVELVSEMIRERIKSRLQQESEKWIIEEIFGNGDYVKPLGILPQYDNWTDIDNLD